jgi:5-methylcytosine-specific restriction endonuclease McrA
LELGYSSLFTYLTQELRYSESSAIRRARVAKAAVSVPAICDYLKNEKVSLAAVTACAGVLAKEGEKILERLQGKSKDEAEWIAASFNPVPLQSIKDHIKQLVVASPAPQNDLFAATTPSNLSSDHRDTQSQEKFKISFSVGSEFMSRLKRVQELTFEGSVEDCALENIFCEALEAYIEKYCPKEKQKRKEQREARKERDEKVDEICDCPEAEVETKLQEANRYVPASIRDEALKRDDYQCSFVAEDGTRCSSRMDLEIDHVIPFAVGGKTAIENLRVLCAAHNLHAARKVFGENFMKSKISKRRPEGAQSGLFN